jgi:hypothetical protein
MIEEAGVLRGQDRLPEDQRDLVVPDDDPPFHRELADERSVPPEHPRDGVGSVVVERGDFGQVVGVGEQDAAQRAAEGCGQEQRDNAGLAGEADNDSHRAVAFSAGAGRQVPV